MAEIIWTKKARNDLRNIYEFISLDSDFYAGRFILKLIGLADSLQHFPLAGRIVPEKEDSSIRELIEGNYRIFYRTSKGNTIFILRVHHAARQIR